MIQKYDIIVYLAITNHKIAQIVLPQLLHQSDIDKIVLLVGSDDTYMKGFLHSILPGHQTKIEIEYLQNKSLDLSLSDFFKKQTYNTNEIHMFFGDQICFISPAYIKNTTNFLITNPDINMMFPACVNTERTTYIFQVLNIVKPNLLWKWDTNYLDEFNFKKTKATFHINLHEQFINDIEQDKEEIFAFEQYFLNKKEIKPYHGFAIKGDAAKNHFKLKNHFFNSNEAPSLSVIYGKALCAWFSNKSYLSEIEKTDILKKYQSIGKKIYDRTSTPVNQTELDDINEISLSLAPGAIFSSSTNNDFNIKFAISSHISTQHKTLPILLKSMSESNIPEEHILVVVGGASHDYIERKNGILYSYVTHNSFDHNATIDIVEKGWGGEWWFILHDTTKVGPNFYTNILQYGPKANHIAALKDGWLNMGLFSYQCLKDMSDYILKLKNCNKMQAILSEKLYTRMTDYDFYDIVEQINFPFSGDIYGDKIDRQVMHMPTIDLYKFQSFHFHSESVKKLINEWLVN